MRFAVWPLVPLNQVIAIPFPIQSLRSTRFFSQMDLCALIGASWPREFDQLPRDHPV